MFVLCAFHCWKDNKNRAVVATVAAVMPFSRFSSGHYQIVICVTLLAAPTNDVTPNWRWVGFFPATSETSPNIAWHVGVCSAGKISKLQNEIKSQKKPPEEELESELMRWVWGIILRKNKETGVYRLGFGAQFFSQKWKACRKSNPHSCPKNMPSIVSTQNLSLK